MDFLTKRGLEVPSDDINAICSRSFPEAAQYTIDRFGTLESADDLPREWNSMAIYACGHTVPSKLYAKEYLSSLIQQSAKLGIATSLPAVLYEPALLNHGIMGLFDIICSTNEMSYRKTNLNVFLLAASKLGTDPKQCMIFEDIPQAIKSAKPAGMTVYEVYDESSKEHWTLIQQIADGVLYDFNDALLPK